MADEINETLATATEKAVSGTNWCNFCGFTSESFDEYIAHSCTDVIESTGQKITKTSLNACI